MFPITCIFAVGAASKVEIELIQSQVFSPSVSFLAGSDAEGSVKQLSCAPEPNYLWHF